MKRLCAALLFAAAGCSASGPSTPALAPTPSATSHANAPALASGSAKIVIPSRTKKSERGPGRSWVSPSTMSVGINATGADGFEESIVTAVGPGDANCATVPAGVSCTVGFLAPAGVDGISITTFDQPNSYYGVALATAYVTGVDILEQGNNALTFTMGGIVGRPLVLSPSTFAVTAGTPATLTLGIAGDDFDGNPIGFYDSPLSITQTDTTGTYTLSATSIADSSATPSITVAYDGGSAPTTITVSTTSSDTALFFGPQQATLTITPR